MIIFHNVHVTRCNRAQIEFKFLNLEHTAFFVSISDSVKKTKWKSIETLFEGGEWRKWYKKSKNDEKALHGRRKGHLCGNRKLGRPRNPRPSFIWAISNSNLCGINVGEIKKRILSLGPRPSLVFPSLFYEICDFKIKKIHMKSASLL